VIIEYYKDEKLYSADLNKPNEIGIRVERVNGVSSFGIANASYKVYKDGDFIGNKNQGSGCNLETIVFTPHGNSTHTECFGHIAFEPYFVNDFINDKLYFSLVHTFNTKIDKGDAVLDFSSLNLNELTKYEALIIRTLPNSSDKLHRDYSGQNAPYILTDDMQKLVAAGIEHIVLDLPSVDKEWDNGALASHHIFWQFPENIRKSASITEFAFIPDNIQDGEYLLKLNIANFVSDAAPSRPILYATFPKS
jgi:hypothetical protein